MHCALILLPFISVMVLNLPLRKAMRELAFWLALLLAALQTSWTFLPVVSGWYQHLDQIFSLLKLNFSVDNLSRVMLFCIGIIVFVTLIVEKYITRDNERLFNFVNLALIVLAGMNGLVMTRDVFTLYVFLEITSVASFILIGYNKEQDAFEAAFKYIVMSVVASALLLSAIALFLFVSGGTGFSTLAFAMRNSPQSLLIKFAVAIFICACFIKGGSMPFHGWLPDAYSASPKAVSVLLAGIVTKCVGVYTLIRLVSEVFIFDHAIKTILLVVGTISIIFGAVAAITQSDFKRMLAYSSISQMGYIILGLGSGTALGLAGAVFHIFNHAIFKSLLFVNAAAVELQTGTRDMDRLSGLGAKMPFTGTTSILASLSCTGIPPLAGFWSKLIIVIALWMSGDHVFSVIAILSSILTLAYFLSMQRRVFFGKLKEDLVSVKEAGWGLIFPMVLLGAITVGAGVFVPLLVNSFLLPIGFLRF